MGESFKVFVTKDYLKFSAAHFIAYKGFREALHGHNYRVSVEVEGQLGPEGYVVDFGVVKRIARELCGQLDERVLVPAASDVLSVTERDGQIILVDRKGRSLAAHDRTEQAARHGVESIADGGLRPWRRGREERSWEVAAAGRYAPQLLSFPAVEPMFQALSRTKRA